MISGHTHKILSAASHIVNNQLLKKNFWLGRKIINTFRIMKKLRGLGWQTLAIFIFHLVMLTVSKSYSVSKTLVLYRNILFNLRNVNYGNLDYHIVTTTFWQKRLYRKQMSIENDKTIPSNGYIVETFKDYFKISANWMKFRNNM